MKCLLGAVSAAVLLTSSAFAADMPVKAPVYKAPGFNWTGFYAGVDAGYNWSSTDLFVPAAPLAGTPSPKPRSFTAGGHVGYLYQFNSPVVIGAEADVSWMNGDATSQFPGSLPVSVYAKTKWDASLRAIVGYAVDTNLIYATGGASWLNSNGCVTFTAAPTTCLGNTDYSKTQVGWTIGAGFAHAFTPNLIARVEYLYADYGNFSYVATGLAGGTANVATKSNKVRAGLSWKFGSL